MTGVKAPLARKGLSAALAAVFLVAFLAEALAGNHAYRLFVDGLALPVREDLLAKGQLPHIERIFVRGGVRVGHAVSSLPSVTYANSVSLLTGRFPGHHGVLGNRWFDRHRLILQDYGHPDTYREVNDDFRAVRRQEFHIKVDNNWYLPTQRAVDNPNPSTPMNPYFGLPYIESSAFKLNQDGNIEQKRATLSQRQEFGEIDWLGNPSVTATYYEQDEPRILTRQDEMSGVGINTNGTFNNNFGRQ
ncbi:MAG: alkaline phosphatase family protein, partial [Proteobacteria bacterium]|nr:alkaline phosphatase family protein [Pseudomonadota bacterium]